MEKSRLPVFFAGSNRSSNAQPTRGGSGSGSRPTGHVSHKGGAAKLGDRGPPRPSLPSPPPLSPPPLTTVSSSCAVMSNSRLSPVTSETGHVHMNSRSALPNEDSNNGTLHTKDDAEAGSPDAVTLAAAAAAKAASMATQLDEDDDDSVFIHDSTFSPPDTSKYGSVWPPVNGEAKIKLQPEKMTGVVVGPNRTHGENVGNNTGGGIRSPRRSSGGRSSSASSSTHRRTPPPVPPRKQSIGTSTGTSTRSRSPSVASSSSGASHGRLCSTAHCPPSSDGRSCVSSSSDTISKPHQTSLSAATQPANSIGATLSTSDAASTTPSSSSSSGKPTQCNPSQVMYRYNVARKRGLQKEAGASPSPSRLQRSGEGKQGNVALLDNNCARDISGEAECQQILRSTATQRGSNSSASASSPTRIGMGRRQGASPASHNNACPSPNAKEPRTQTQQIIKHHKHLGAITHRSTSDTNNTNTNILPGDKHYHMRSDRHAANWHNLDLAHTDTPGVARELSLDKLTGSDHCQLDNWQEEKVGVVRQHQRSVDRTKVIKQTASKHSDHRAMAAHLYDAGCSGGSISSSNSSSSHSSSVNIVNTTAACTLPLPMDSIQEGVRTVAAGAETEADMDAEQHYDAAYQARVVFSHAHSVPWGGVTTPLRASPRWRSYSSPSCGVRMAKMRAHKRFGDDDASSQRRSSSSLSDCDKTASLSRASPISMGSRGSTPIQLERGPTPTTPLYIDPCNRASFGDSSDEHDYEEIDEYEFRNSPPVSPRLVTFDKKLQQKRDYEAVRKDDHVATRDRIIGNSGRRRVGTVNKPYTMDVCSQSEELASETCDMNLCVDRRDVTTGSPVHLKSHQILSVRSVYPDVSSGNTTAVTLSTFSSGANACQKKQSKGLSQVPSTEASCDRSKHQSKLSASSMPRKLSTEANRSRSSSATSRSGEPTNSNTECPETLDTEIDMVPPKYSSDRNWSRKISPSGHGEQIVASSGDSKPHVRQSASVKSMSLETCSQVSGTGSKTEQRPKAVVSQKSVGTMTPISALKMTMSQQRDSKSETASLQSQQTSRQDSRDYRSSKQPLTKSEKASIQGSRHPSELHSKNNKSHTSNKHGRRLPQRPLMPTKIRDQKNCSGDLSDRLEQCSEAVRGEIDSSALTGPVSEAELGPGRQESDRPAPSSVTHTGSKNTCREGLMAHHPANKLAIKGQKTDPSNTCETDSKSTAVTSSSGQLVGEETDVTSDGKLQYVTSDSQTVFSVSVETQEAKMSNPVNDTDMVLERDSVHGNAQPPSETASKTFGSQSNIIISSNTLPQDHEVHYKDVKTSKQSGISSNMVQASHDASTTGSSIEQNARASKLQKPGLPTRKARQLPTPKVRQSSVKAGPTSSQQKSHHLPQSEVTAEVTGQVRHRYVVDERSELLQSDGASTVSDNTFPTQEVESVLSDRDSKKHGVTQQGKLSRLTPPSKHSKLTKPASQSKVPQTKVKEIPAEIILVAEGDENKEGLSQKLPSSPKSKLKPPTMSKPRKLSLERTQFFETSDFKSNRAKFEKAGSTGSRETSRTNTPVQHGATHSSEGQEQDDPCMKSPKSPTGAMQPKLVKPYSSLSRSSPFGKNFGKTRTGGACTSGSKPAESAPGLYRLDEDYTERNVYSSSSGGAGGQHSTATTDSVSGQGLNYADGQNSYGATDCAFERNFDKTAGSPQQTDYRDITQSGRDFSKNSASVNRFKKHENDGELSAPIIRTNQRTDTSESIGAEIGELGGETEDGKEEDERNPFTDNNSNIQKREESVGATFGCGSASAECQKYTRGPGSPGSSAPASESPNKRATQKYVTDEGRKQGQGPDKEGARSIRGRRSSREREPQQSQAKTVERDGICQASALNKPSNYYREFGNVKPGIAASTPAGLAENGDSLGLCAKNGTDVLSAYTPELRKMTENPEIMDPLAADKLAGPDYCVSYGETNTVLVMESGGSHAAVSHLHHPALVSAKCLLSNELQLDSHPGLVTVDDKSLIGSDNLKETEYGSDKCSNMKPNKLAPCENSTTGIMCPDERKSCASHLHKQGAQKVDTRAGGRSLVATPHLRVKGEPCSGSASSVEMESCNKDMVCSPTNSQRDSWDASQETVSTDNGILGNLKMSESGYDSWRSQSSSMTTGPSDELSDPEQRSKTWDRATTSGKLDGKSKMRDLCFNYRQGHTQSRGRGISNESEDSENSEQGEYLPTSEEEELPAVSNDAFVRSDSENTLTTIMSTRGGPGNMDDDSEMGSPHESDGQSDHDQMVDSSTEDYQDIPGSLQYGNGNWEGGQIFVWQENTQGGGFAGFSGNGGVCSGGNSNSSQENRWASSNDKKVFKSDSDETILADDGYQMPVVENTGNATLCAVSHESGLPAVNTWEDTNPPLCLETTNQSSNSMTNLSDANLVGRNDRTDNTNTAQSYVETWRCHQMGHSEPLGAIPLGTQIETEEDKSPQSHLSCQENPLGQQGEAAWHPPKHLEKNLSAADGHSDSPDTKRSVEPGPVDKHRDMGATNQAWQDRSGSNCANQLRQSSTAVADNTPTCQPPLPAASVSTCKQQQRQQANNYPKLQECVTSASPVNTGQNSVSSSLAKTKTVEDCSEQSQVFPTSDEYENICDDYLERLPPCSSQGSSSNLGSSSTGSRSSDSVSDADVENDVFIENSDLFVIPPSGYVPPGPPSPQRSISSPSLQDEDVPTFGTGMLKSNSFLLSQNSLHRTKATSSLNLKDSEQSSSDGNGNGVKEMAVSQDSLHTLPTKSRQRKTESSRDCAQSSDLVSDVGGAAREKAKSDPPQNVDTDASEKPKSNDTAVDSSKPQSEPNVKSTSSLKEAKCGKETMILEVHPSSSKDNSSGSDKSSSESDTKMVVSAGKEGQKRRFGRFGMLRFRGRNTPPPKEPSPKKEDMKEKAQQVSCMEQTINTDRDSANSRAKKDPPKELRNSANKDQPLAKRSDKTVQQSQSRLKMPSPSPASMAAGRKSSLPTTATQSPKLPSKIQPPGISKRHKSENDKSDIMNKSSPKQSGGFPSSRKQAPDAQPRSDSKNTPSSSQKPRQHFGFAKLGLGRSSQGSPPTSGRFTPTLSNVPKIEKTKTISEGSNDTTDSGLSSISSADTSPKDMRQHNARSAILSKSGLKQPVARPTKLALPGSRLRMPGNSGHQRKMSSDSDQSGSSSRFY